MTLSVIGAGFWRTGTASLKLALEQLGFGPCYHGENALAGSTTLQFWERALDGGAVEWNGVFNGYRSATDMPAAFFYRQLADRYPSAKVILTVRDPNEWFQSMQSLVAGAAAGAIDAFPGKNMLNKLSAAVFGAGGYNRESAIAAFERHNAEVRASIPAQRLLVYESSAGWAPLCQFLGVSIPAGPFPRVNSKAEIPDDPAILREVYAAMHDGRPEVLTDVYVRLLRPRQ